MTPTVPPSCRRRHRDSWSLLLPLLLLAVGCRSVSENPTPIGVLWVDDEPTEALVQETDTDTAIADNTAADNTAAAAAEPPQPALGGDPPPAATPTPAWQAAAAAWQADSPSAPPSAATMAADPPGVSGTAAATAGSVTPTDRAAAAGPVGATLPLGVTIPPDGGVANLQLASDLIGFSRDLGGGIQAITIINASHRWMAVYHIDSGGQIRLTSSRPLDEDFTILFNATSPLPEEIRRLQGK